MLLKGNPMINSANKMKMTKQKTAFPEIILEKPAAWKTVRGLKPRLRKAVQATVESLPESLQGVAKRAQLTILLTSDAGIKRLNRDWRGLDKPTNVLSFPGHTKAQLGRMKKGKTEVYLGDIAIAYQYVVAEAKRDRKLLLNHLVHLVVHGVLHLFGYDHVSSSAAMKMERMEKKIMSELGLPDPYDPS